MRCAIVGSGTRKARAISCGGQAAEQLQRQRDARLGRQHRMAGGEDQAQQVVADRRHCARRRARRRNRARCAPPALRGRGRAASQLRARAILSRRRWSSARRSWRCVISQAPGLSGMPGAGQCSSAATSASCASSSARPMSRTRRATPATILADSMRQTAPIAWCATGALRTSAARVSRVGTARPIVHVASAPRRGRRGRRSRGRT